MANNLIHHAMAFNVILWWFSVLTLFVCVCVWFWPSPFQVIPWPLDFGSCRFYTICLLRHELLNDCGITGVPHAEFLALPFHDQLPLACLGYIIIFVQSLFLSPHIFPVSLDPGHCQATIVPLFVWALGVQEHPWLNSCLVYTPKFSNSLFSMPFFGVNNFFSCSPLLWN